MKTFMLAVLTFLFVVASCEEKPTDILGPILGKKCSSDTDCDINECCTPTFALGHRCRGHLSEGSICATFTETVINRLHRRCQCEAGTTCTHTYTIVGLYKVNKCVKDSPTTV